MLHHNQNQLIVHFLPFSSFWDISFPCLSLSDNIAGIYKKEKTFKKFSIKSSISAGNSDHSANTIHDIE